MVVGMYLSAPDFRLNARELEKNAKNNGERPAAAGHMLHPK
jgi:hypothetical protein